MLMLSGCAVSKLLAEDRKPQNRVCVHLTETPASPERCVGLLDVEYQYVNGDGLFSRGSAVTEVNPRIRQHYVTQNSENSCYAAALQTAFKYYDVQYPQERFQHAIADQCIGAGIRPLTFSQILYSATRVHLRSGGIWYADAPDNFGEKQLNQMPFPTKLFKVSSGFQSGEQRAVFQKVRVCQSARGEGTSWSALTLNWDLDGWFFARLGLKAIPATLLVTNPMAAGQFPPIGPQKPASVRYLETLNLYRVVTWSKNGLPTEPQGGIAPIQDPGDFVTRFVQGVPIVAGLNSEQFGHVVTVSAVRYVPTFKLPDNYYMKGLRVEWVEVLDPALPEEPAYRMTGDEFFSRARFLFALYVQPPQ